jgi:nitrite reductase/ring-hydroxylating ferredoxin subunit
VFARGPLDPCAERVEQRLHHLPKAGDFITVQIPSATGEGDRSIIVLRNDAGEVAAFDNICIHRGAQMLDGSLIGGPYMQRSTEADGRPFDPSAHRLSRVRLEVWEGFVFVNQNIEADPLGPRLQGLTDVVSRYDMAGYVTVHHQRDRWNTNWKIMVENFMDEYHVFHVHKASFGANGDNTLDTTMFPGTEAWAHHRVDHAGGPDFAHADNTALTGESAVCPRAIQLPGTQRVRLRSLRRDAAGTLNRCGRDRPGRSQPHKLAAGRGPGQSGRPRKTAKSSSSMRSSSSGSRSAVRTHSSAASE